MRVLGVHPLAAAAGVLLGVHLVHDVTGFGNRAFDAAFASWYQPAVFAACALVTLTRAFTRRAERLAWSLVGAGLLLYAIGSLVFLVAHADDATPPFPSVADALWLLLYPLAAAGITLLLRQRLPHVHAMVWLDGVIGAAVVAALASALLLQPVFDVTVQNGAQSAARLAYPIGAMGCLGFVVVIWSLSGRRAGRVCVLLGSAFALLAVGDSVYVVQAARGEWMPGGLLDLPYALATMLLAAAAWSAPRDGRSLQGAGTSGAVLPVAFAFTALGLAVYAEIEGINPLATILAFAALVAVVVRLALSLAWSNRQSADLAALASTDPLTGLAHHGALHDHLTRSVERARRDGTALSVIALDVDHFKAINDSHGHAEGDRVLEGIARALGGQLRPYDVAARVGGDEFVVLLADADGDATTAIAERCRTAVLQISVDGTPISCSAGVASFPADASDGQELLKLADRALYAAKRAGRSRVRRFDAGHDMPFSQDEQRKLIARLLTGQDAMTTHFQPIVELATGRVGGYEALARFPGVSPVRAPNEWFALARGCGEGHALEAHAVRLALSVPGRPPGTFLSLNVSAGTLLSPELADALPDDLRDVVIELTEDEIFGEGEELDVAVAALRARGARIAIDDAGAGYAGLTQIIRIKPDILKLDRALIRGLHEDGSKLALLEALSRFAVTTGAAVCGEGIETVDELRAVARFDVTYAQGYALARPGPCWPAIDAEVVATATSPVVAGMRLAPAAPDGPVTLGAVIEALSHLRAPSGLDGVLGLIERVMSADEAALSRVVLEAGYVETLSEHDWLRSGERFDLGDYPTTARAIADQVPGQIVPGDPLADQAEVDLLRDAGFGTVLMVPVVLGGVTVGLLELYRRAARPYTSTEIDQARMLAHQLGPAVRDRQASLAGG